MTDLEAAEQIVEMCGDDRSSAVQFARVAEFLAAFRAAAREQALKTAAASIDEALRTWFGAGGVEGHAGRVNAHVGESTTLAGSRLAALPDAAGVEPGPAPLPNDLAAIHQKLSDALARYEAANFDALPWGLHAHRVIAAVRAWDVARRAASDETWIPDPDRTGQLMRNPAWQARLDAAEPAPPCGLLKPLTDAPCLLPRGHSGPCDTLEAEPAPPTVTPLEIAHKAIRAGQLEAGWFLSTAASETLAQRIAEAFEPTAPPTAAPAEFVPPYHALPGPTYDKDPRPSEDIIREIRDAGTPLNVWHQRFLDEERNRRNADTRLVAMRDERDDARAQLAEAMNRNMEQAYKLAEAQRDATFGTPLFNAELKAVTERAEAAEREGLRVAKFHQARAIEAERREQALREQCAKWADVLAAARDSTSGQAWIDIASVERETRAASEARK